MIKPFDPKIEVAILIHPLEARRRIATGRMAHLFLENSQLIEGHNFSENAAVNALIERSDAQKVVLYPGKNAFDLSSGKAELQNLIPCDKNLVVFVIDGTWATARQTMNVSTNLKALPKVCFTPDRPSQFRVRKQPRPFCHSTIEAIHQLIEMIGPLKGFSVQGRSHDGLLAGFQFLVANQLQLIQNASNPRRLSGQPRWRTKLRRLRRRP